MVVETSGSVQKVMLIGFDGFTFVSISCKVVSIQMEVVSIHM